MLLNFEYLCELTTVITRIPSKKCPENIRNLGKFLFSRRQKKRQMYTVEIRLLILSLVETKQNSMIFFISFYSLSSIRKSLFLME